MLNITYIYHGYTIQVTLTVTLGSKQIDRMICIACKELIGNHSKNGLARCLVRIQGTLVNTAIANQMGVNTSPPSVS